MKRSGKWITVLALLVLVAAGCGGDDQQKEGEAPAKKKAVATTAASGKEGDVSLSITSPKEGEKIRGNIATLDVQVTGVGIVKADGDTSGTTGHLHVFVGREPVAEGETIPKAEGIIHTAESPIQVPGLRTGKQKITVVLGDGAHARLTGVEASVTVDVEGASVDAAAPATVEAGKPATVDVTVAGVTLVPADGDSSGKTGHLHLHIDREPTPAGQPIPLKEPTLIHSAQTKVELPVLGPGEHTVWVILGDGNHVAVNPTVGDKVTFTVA